ncbi:MAG: glucose-6-phosphate isomerase [Spirochaetota bacterium]|nr:MAG: glucose-6-phosphate isomerase [Spirochaetota bacterium]
MKPVVEDKMVVEPFSVGWDPKDGVMDNPDNHIERYLKNLTNMWIDKNAVEQYLKEYGNTLVYEVYEKEIPHRDGEIQFCSSITHPGKIGKEYFMTKGHFHARRDTAEIYYCLLGKGYMLMEKEDGEFYLEEMYPGRTVYVPGHYAHRSINVGENALISLAVYAGDAGHDYGSIETSGFKHAVIEKDGKPRIIENPRFGKMLE